MVFITIGQLTKKFYERKFDSGRDEPETLQEPQVMCDVDENETIVGVESSKEICYCKYDRGGG